MITTVNPQQAEISTLDEFERGAKALIKKDN